MQSPSTMVDGRVQGVQTDPRQDRAPRRNITSIDHRNMLRLHCGSRLETLREEDIRVANGVVVNSSDGLIPAARVELRCLERMGAEDDQPTALFSGMSLSRFEELAANADTAERLRDPQV